MTLYLRRHVLVAEASTLGTVLSDDRLVFSTPEGQPFRPNTVTRAWVTLAKRAGVKRIRFHDARHTHVTIMLTQGVHPKIVQERLGHTSIEVTLDIYSHVAPGLQEAAAAGFERDYRSGRGLGDRTTDNSGVSGGPGTGVAGVWRKGGRLGADARRNAGGAGLCFPVPAWALAS